MADEEIKQPAETSAAESEYEYEYIELAEGEELPEGVEYEYEYVEVPVEAEELISSGQAEISAPEAAEEPIVEQLAEKRIEPSVALTDEEIPELPTEEKEPQFEIEMPAEPLEETSVPSLDNPVEEANEPINTDDFLKMDEEELSLDEILDDNPPLPALDDDLEQQLYGTPEPVLNPVPEEAEYSENAQIAEDAPIDELLSEDVAELQITDEVSGEIVETEEGNNEYTEAEAIEEVIPVQEEITAGYDEGEVVPESFAEPEVPLEVTEEALVDAEAVSETEIDEEAVAEENVPEEIKEESVIENITEEMPTVTEEEYMEPAAVEPEMPKPIEEIEAEEAVSAPADVEYVEEEYTPAEEIVIEAEPAPVEDNTLPEIIEEDVIAAHFEEEPNQLQAEDVIAEAVPVEAEIEAEEPAISLVAAEQEIETADVYIQGLTEDTVVPPFIAPSSEEAEPDDGAFHQTDEQPLRFDSRSYEPEEYPLLQAASRPFSKQGAMQSFQAEDGLKYVLLENLDFAAHELENWSLILFDDFRMRLDPEEPDLTIAREANTIRYAKVLKGGKTKLELFNEETYNFVAPGDKFVKVRGNYIYGNIANNSKLIVKDFININLVDKAGQFISFNKPAAGVLVGPKAAKLYFSDVQGIVVPADREIRADKSREESRAARWYSGSLNDKYFEFGANMQSTEFVGTPDLKNIHVNVGTSTYGWNVAFDNGLFMSFRDLQEYQTKYGQLPSPNGVISHGSQSLKFSNVEKIVVYETAQYFSYGRV